MTLVVFIISVISVVPFGIVTFAVRINDTLNFDNYLIFGGFCFGGSNLITNGG
jgi:hypothetical protein